MRRLRHSPRKAAYAETSALDRTHRGQHVGSTSLRAFIERVEPTLVVCGHVHEGRGIERIGATTVVNCGPAAAGCYALVELAEAARVDLRQARLE